MKYINTFSDKCDVSQVALGCMRISDKSDKEMDFYLGNAIDLGINYFDHADIYGRGKWEGDNCPWWHFPEQYADRDDAVRIAKAEKEKDPSWVYHVEFYDR